MTMSVSVSVCVSCSARKLKFGLAIGYRALIKNDVERRIVFYMTESSRTVHVMFSDEYRSDSEFEFLLNSSAH